MNKNDSLGSSGQKPLTRTDNPWVEINNQMIQMIAAGFTREEAFELVKLLITVVNGGH